MEVLIKPSKNKNKKFDAIIDGKKKISFGASGYSDYTRHKDPERKEQYINRHKKNENWGRDGVDSAGWLSRFILWEKPTLKGAIDNANKKYADVKFKLSK